MGGHNILRVKGLLKDQINNQNVENILRVWIVNNTSTKRSFGVYFVPWQKKISHHQILGRLPYRALFGNELKVYLSSTNLPADIFEILSNEENLENVLQENIKNNVNDMSSKKKNKCFNMNNICYVCEKSGSEFQCIMCKKNINSNSYSVHK